MMFRLFTLCIMLIAAMLPASYAQEGRRRPGDAPPAEGHAQLHITPKPNQIPRSLKELCDSSTLIVEGTVRTALPARETSPRAFETDVLIDVNIMLKGSNTIQQVLVSQRGGTKGGLVVTPVQYSLLQPGEQYLLFLTEDQRPNIPHMPGM